MLAPKYRLRLRSDFTSVSHGKISAYGENMTLRAVKNGLPYSRWGFVVSKKYSPLATRRNSHKRSLRAAAARLAKAAPPGFDIVVYTIGKETKNFDFSRLLQQLETLLQKIGIHNK